MAGLRFKRGTRAQLDAAAGSGQLHAGEPYLVTDEGVMALGLGPGDYADVGSGGGDYLAPLAMAEVALSGASALGTDAFGKLHSCADSGSYTVTLPPPGGQGGKRLGLRVSGSGGGLVTVARNAAETINGRLANRHYISGELATFHCDGVNWIAEEQRRGLGCLVHRNGVDQTAVARLTESIIRFNVKAYDIGGCFDTADNALKPPAPGTYLCFVSLMINAISDQKNGYIGYKRYDAAGTLLQTAYATRQTVSATAPMYMQFDGTYVIGLGVGEYVKFFGFHYESGDQIFDGRPEFTYMECTRINGEVR